MNTDLANLGPSLNRTPDLGVKSKAETMSAKMNSQRDTAQDSFAKTLAKTDSKPTSRPDRPEPRMAQKKTESRETETVRTRSEGDRLIPTASKPQQKVSAAAKPAEGVKQASTREQAMLEFMDSMESEFGIPSTSIVEAMAELPSDVQSQSPTDTASQVIGQLSEDFELSQEDQSRAMQLYSGLLQQLTSLPQQGLGKTLMLDGQNTQYLAPAAAGAGAVALTELSSQDRRAMLNNSLDKMNQKFFMHGEAVPASKLDAGLDLPKSRTGIEAYQNMRADSSGLEALQRQMSVPVPNPQGLGKDILPDSAEMNSQDSSSSEAAGYEGLAKALAALGAAATAVDQALPAKPEIGTDQVDMKAMFAGGNPMAVNASAQKDMGFGQESSAGDFLSDRDKELTELSAKDQGDFRMPEVALGKDHLPRAEILGAGAVGAKALSGDMMSATAERAQNVQQIMNRAQVLIKDGGGEAKMVLNPEGLGQIHLKVVVDGGKVDVQMQAETHEAKKLLESSLQDMKHGLGSRNLSLEGLKVDVGSNLSSDMGKNDSQPQKQMNFQNNGNRDHAQSFMGQFRDENFSRRDGSWDSPGLKNYGIAALKVDPIAPAPTEAVKRYQGQNKGNSVDRVA